MRELNWNSFELKFNGKQQAAFERMCYALFCSRFEKHYGIFAYKNQIGIETEPIEFNGKLIGFQAKYIEPSVTFLSRKKIIIESLEKAKKNNPTIKEIYFFVNKPFSESRKAEQKSPKYKLDIEEKAKELNLTIVWQVRSHIEKQLSNSENLFIAKEFFPEFIEKELDKPEQERLLDTSRTAIIQIEIAKIIAEFTYDWTKSEAVLNKFYTYVDFRNEIIAREILNFLCVHVSSAARHKMPSSIASEIQGLVLTYFPSSYGDDEKTMRIENGKQCVYIGFHLAYDALIYTNNFRVAEWGLNIWKFIYREAKRNKLPELVDAVLQQYKELEGTLKRPERNDLGNARELVKIFKDDLETYDLSFPPLPQYLYKIVTSSDN